MMLEEAKYITVIQSIMFKKAAANGGQHHFTRVRDISAI